MNSVFPFAAIVGQDRLKAALALVAVDPKIGGLLISGPRGSAKSTIARSLADLTQQGHFVTLPLGATEDRVVGTLNLDKALSDAKFEFSPGLLARAHEGMLYVDEVNLLPDHLVDLLLDVAASGRNVVERDGISHAHDARFVLVGTMNPDEGELRPQLLDRFGMMATVTSDLSLDDRQLIVERRLAFDQNPKAFATEFEAEAQTTRSLFLNARQALEQIELEPEVAQLIAQRCADANVEGYRADIIMHRAARAFAALQQSRSVTAAHVDFVEEFVLSHRRRPNDSNSDTPSDTNGSSGSSNDKSKHNPGNPLRVGQNPRQYQSRSTLPQNEASRAEQSTIQGAYGRQATQLTTIDSINAQRALSHFSDVAKKSSYTTQQLKSGVAPGKRAKGAYATRQFRTGRAAWGMATVDWVRTLVDKDNLSAWRNNGKRQRILLKHAVRRLRQLNLVLLDTSASTLSGRGQMKAKGVIQALSARSYLRRERFSLVTFGNDQINCVLPPQRARKSLTDRLHNIQAGGGTPLIKVIHYAAHLIQRTGIGPGECHVYLITDGRSSHPVDTVTLPDQARVTVVDVESSAIRLGLSRRLAQWLRADYLHIDDLHAAMVGQTPMSAHRAGS